MYPDYDKGGPGPHGDTAGFNLIAAKLHLVVSARFIPNRAVILTPPPASNGLYEAKQRYFLNYLPPMPYNVTVDDISPLIKYIQPWTSYVSTVESEQHFGRTIHTTQSQGAQAHFSFNGTAVYIFGARNSAYGQCKVRIDDQSYDVDQHISQSDGQYQQLLFKNDSLPNQLHEVYLTYRASPGTYINLDYVVWTSGDDIVGAKNVTIDDKNSTWEYQGEAWKSSESTYVEFYHDETMHYTQVGGAIARVSFEGNAVYLYGGLFHDHGTFTIDIDGKNSATLSGTANTTTTDIRAQELMYYADGLGPGIHNLTITNNPGSLNKIWLDVDYINVTQPDRSRIPKDNNSNMPAIIGGVCGAVIGVIILGIAVWYYLRWRRRQANTGFVDLLDEHLAPYSIPIGYASPNPRTVGAYQSFYAGQRSISDHPGTDDSMHHLIHVLTTGAGPSTSSINLIGSSSELVPRNIVPSPAPAHTTPPLGQACGSVPIVTPRVGNLSKHQIRTRNAQLRNQPPVVRPPPPSNRSSQLPPDYEQAIQNTQY